MPTVVRVDPSNVMRTASNAPTMGNPALYAVAGSTIGLFTNALGTTPAMAYTDVTGATACPINAPVTLPPSGLAQSTTGPQGQFGFWLVPGLYYYTVLTPDGQFFGPFPVEAIGTTSNWLTLSNMPFIDVRSYGAKGDGVTNDTAAFAAAFAAVGAVSGGSGLLGNGGAIVYVPTGNYLATVVVPSNVHLMGESKIGTNFYAPSNGATIIATAPQSTGISITNMTVWLNGKQNCTAYAVRSTSCGYFAHLRVVGGGDLGIGGIIGTGFKIESVGSSDYDLVTRCLFEDIDLDTSPSRGFVIGHNDDGSCRPISLCSFRDIRIETNGAANPLFDIVGNADTNYVERIVLAQALNVYGIVLNSGNPTAENNVSGWTFNGVSGGGRIANPHPPPTWLSFPSPFLFYYCTYIQITDLESESDTPYTIGHAPVSVFMDIPVGVIPGTVHLRTWQILGGLRLGSTDNGSYIATPKNGISCANGSNNHNVSIAEASFIRISGPTAPFAIGGFTGGEDGRPLKVFNTAPYAMTITNQDSSATAGNGILTNTGADVVLRAGTSFATFIYSGVDSLWILESTN